MCGFKCYIFVQEELEEYHQHNRQNLWNNLVHLHYVDAIVEYQIAQDHSAQADSQENGETGLSPVFDFEVISAVEYKAGGNASKHTDAVRQQIVPMKHIDKQGVKHEIQCRGTATNNTVQQECTEFSYEWW